VLTFLAPAVAAVAAFALAVVPPIGVPESDPTTEGLFPAPPGYLLPWPGGEIQTVTQGEETSFTHNGLAAYAFDFDLAYDTVVAARSGKVALIRDDSNIGGCNAIFSSATNFVLIDHGDETSSLYLHLAYGSVLVEPGDLVEQGQPIAISGETGVTCGGDGGPGAHLHFQVQRTGDGGYFKQSLPIAFDDVPSNQGVPQEGRSYVSGNFGKGQPQKIKLTPRRVARVFNPVATPADASLIEADPNHIVTPTPEAAAPGEDGAPEWPTPGPDTATAEPDTATPEPDTPTPAPDTPTSTHTAPPPTATATATDTPEPAPTDTPTPDFAATQAVLSAEETASAEPTADPGTPAP
jgi:murein DD-endopeptidase MepM/ murein hydrolase activator NlpD